LTKRGTYAAQPAARPLEGGRERSPVGLILIIAAVVFVGLRWRCVNIPLERDEGEYAYIAQRMLVGEVPYRDIFDQKPPGVFFVYLVPVAVFGDSVAAIHITMYLWTAATAAVLFLVTRRVAGESAAAWSVLIFALLTIDPSWQATAANTEQFMLLPMTASLWLALRAMDRGSRLAWLGCGAAAMAACWFKQVAATQVGFVAVLAAAWAWRTRRAIGAIVVDLLAYAGGVAAVFVPVAGYFALRGAWAEFVDCVWTHNVSYASRVPWAVGRELLVNQYELQRGGLWLVVLLAAASAVNVSRRGRRVAAFHAGWLLFSAIGVSIGLMFRGHYFVQLAPALASAAGTTVAWALSLPLGRIPTIARQAGVVFAASLVVLPGVYAHREFYFQATSAEQVGILYGANPFEQNRALADVIQGHTTVSDRVLIFGSEPQFLFHSARKSATRYIFFYPLFMDLPGTVERQREALREIEAARPRCILLTNLQASLLANPRSPQELQQGVSQLLRQGYRLIALRESTPLGTRIVRDPAEAQRLLASSKRDSMNPDADMLVFVRE